MKLSWLKERQRCDCKVLADKGLVTEGTREEDRQGNKDRIWKTMQQHDYLIHVTLFDEAVECLNIRFTLFCKHNSHIVRVILFVT